jgi:hypothetical protein
MAIMSGPQFSLIIDLGRSQHAGRDSVRLEEQDRTLPDDMRFVGLAGRFDP